MIFELYVDRMDDFLLDIIFRETDMYDTTMEKRKRTGAYNVLQDDSVKSIHISLPFL